MNNNHQPGNEFQLLKQLFGIFRGEISTQKSGLASYYFLSVLAVIAGVLTPWPLKLIIDHFLEKNDVAAFNTLLNVTLSASVWVVIIAAGFFLLNSIEAVLNTTNKVIIARVREQLNLSIRDRVLAHIQSLPGTTRMKYRSGELVLRMVGDVSIFTRLLTKTMPQMFEHGATTVFTLAVMFAVQPTLGFLGVIMFGGLFLLVRRYGAKLRKTARSKRRHEGSIAGLAQEIIRNLPLIQALGFEQKTRRDFREINEQSLSAGVDSIRVIAEMERMLKFAKGIASTVMIGGGALMVLNGQLTVGELTVFIAYLNKLTKPADKVNDLTDSATRGMAGGEQIARLFDEKSGDLEAINAREIAKMRGEIEFRNVWFAYPEQKQRDFVLKGVNFRLHPDKLTVIMGQSGAGKSTTLSLLLRLFEPTAGEIVIDGVPLAQISATSLRENISVTLQQAYLFSGTIRDVLCGDNTAISDAAIREALTFVDLAEFVDRLPKKLDTKIAEEGLNISGGQQKRLALARAFLLNRPVLVLDEPLANVDAQSATVIMNALKRIRIGRTCMIITHNPALCAIADEVLHLQNGRLFPMQEIA